MVPHYFISKWSSMPGGGKKTRYKTSRGLKISEWWIDWHNRGLMYASEVHIGIVERYFIRVQSSFKWRGIGSVPRRREVLKMGSTRFWSGKVQPKKIGGKCFVVDSGDLKEEKTMSEEYWTDVSISLQEWIWNGCFAMIFFQCWPLNQVARISGDTSVRRIADDKGTYS